RPSPFLTLGLTLLSFFGVMMLAPPRPWLFSILFYVLQLRILLAVERSGNARWLLWLPPMFAIWANMHIQFVNGLAVLGLAVVASCIENLPRRGWLEWPIDFRPGAERIGVLPIAAVTIASWAATFLNPYHYHLYEAAYILLAQQKLYELTIELQALPFRSMVDWIILGTTLAAAFAIGWRRRVRLVWLPLVLVGVVFSFGSQRDVWLVQIAAVCILAGRSSARQGFDSDSPPSSAGSGRSPDGKPDLQKNDAADPFRFSGVQIACITGVLVLLT